ncbi:hypothetical protein AALB39_22400 [Lachnospiraceae bacterium 54-53]
MKSNEERENAVRQLLIDLKGNEQLFEDMKLKIECFLEKISREHLEIKQILYYKYVECKTSVEIAKIMNYDVSMIKKKINKFLDLVNHEGK